jgi:hypothetical protein
MNRDEIRMREGLPPLPDGEGQEYFTPAITADTPSGPAAPIPSENPNTGDPNAGDEN